MVNKFTERLKKIKELNIQNEIYLVVFAIWLTVIFLDSTMFFEYVPSGKIVNITRYIVYAIIAIKIIFYDIIRNRYSKKEFLLYSLIGIIAILSYWFSKYRVIIDLAVFILAARNVEFRKIVKVYFIIGTAIMIISFIASKVGIVPDLVYFRGEGVARHSFGIIYPTDFAAHVFYLILAYCYLRAEKLKIWDYLGVFLLAVFTYVFCDTRLDSISIILCMIFMLYILRVKKRFKIVDLFLTYSIPICAAVFITLTVLYNPNIPIMKSANEALSTRLALGKEGLDKYGFSVFGQKVKMTGNSGLKKYNPDSRQFFIDCSYLYIFLQYGVIVSLLVIASYVWFCRNRIKQGDLILPTIIALIAINSMVAHRLTLLQYSPFILVFVSKHIMSKNNTEKGTKSA